MMTAALMLPPTRSGNTEASITCNRSVPRTRNCASTTAVSSVPMRQVPAGWCTVTALARIAASSSASDRFGADLAPVMLGAEQAMTRAVTSPGKGFT
jgi:hypothetical protein